MLRSSMIRSHQLAALHRNAGTLPRMMKTREQALRDLGRVSSEIWETTSKLAPREAAERAWHEGHPMSVEQLTEEIRSLREQYPA